MNEYGSLLFGFAVGTGGFAATLLHIYWTKRKAAAKAKQGSLHADFAFFPGADDAGKAPKAAHPAHRSL